jgi:hypothetical protein
MLLVVLQVNELPERMPHSHVLAKAAYLFARRPGVDNIRSAAVWEYCSILQVFKLPHAEPCGSELAHTLPMFRNRDQHERPNAHNSLAK